MPKLTEDTIKMLGGLAKAGLNVLLTGNHGVGKTTLFDTLCQMLGVRGGYINCPLTDYYVDWLGVPSPLMEPDNVRVLRSLLVAGQRNLALTMAGSMFHCPEGAAREYIQFLETTSPDESLKFLKPRRLENINFVFFDEINRGDDHFLDSCMEMVQFRRMNGVPLENLKLVWASQNPANSIYHVKELDVPLVDKFGAHVLIEGNPSVDYYVARGFSQEVVQSIIQWYEVDISRMDENKRRLISPRTLETLLRLWTLGADVGDCLLDAMGIPDAQLKHRLENASKLAKFLSITLEMMAAEPEKYREAVNKNLDFSSYFASLLKDAKPEKIFLVPDLFCCLPSEFKTTLLSDKVWKSRLHEHVKKVSFNPAAPGMATFVAMLKIK